MMACGYVYFLTTGARRGDALLGATPETA